MLALNISLKVSNHPYEKHREREGNEQTLQKKSKVFFFLVRDETDLWCILINKMTRYFLKFITVDGICHNEQKFSYNVIFFTLYINSFCPVYETTGTF